MRLARTLALGATLALGFGVAACGDNLKGPADAPPGDAPPDAPPMRLEPCLDRPTDLDRPPNGILPCDLLPPGFSQVLEEVPRETVMEDRSLQPGELAELILTGGPGDRVRIRLSAPVAKLEWNIHGHAGGGTQVVYEEFDVKDVDYKFLPPAQAGWYLLIRNGGQTDMNVAVRVDLFGSVTAVWQ